MKNSIDQHFFDLATNVIAHRCTYEENAELQRILCEKPELANEFERLREEAGIAREALILIEAADTAEKSVTRWPIPEQAIIQLQFVVRKNYPSKPRWRLTWPILITGLGVAAMLVLIVSGRRAKAPEVQVAILAASNFQKAVPVNEPKIRGIWPNAAVMPAANRPDLDDWEHKWPSSDKQPVVKVTILPQTLVPEVIGGSPGQIIIEVRGGKSHQTQKTIKIYKTAEWQAALQQAREFVEGEIK